MTEAVGDQIVARGDPAEIIAMAFNARERREEGVFCQCPEPVLIAEGLMCRRCLLENEAQTSRVIADHAAPHVFVDSDLGICDYCTATPEDPRHHV